MDEGKILAKMLCSAKGDWDYFANKNKAARERYAVGRFLSILAVPHLEAELQSLEQHSKSDVQFRDAFFQVKELTDPDLRRGKMYKDAYNSITAAKSLNEVSLIGDARDNPPIANMYRLVVVMATELACNKQYLKKKTELDLLIYVTRTRASLIHSNELNADEIASSGWRSVSCVNEKQAVVLFSSPSAPTFLREISQKLVNVRE